MDQLYISRGPLAQGGDETEKPRLINPGFGDGYKQTSRDGLNAVLMTPTYSWNLPRAEADGVVAFLRAHVGVTFLWQLPFETSPRKWQTPDGWKRTHNVNGRDVLSITFEERFDLT